MSLENFNLHFKNPIPVSEGVSWTARLVSWDAHRHFFFEFDIVVSWKSGDFFFIRTRLPDDVTDPSKVQKDLHQTVLHALTWRQEYDFSSPESLTEDRTWTAHLTHVEPDGLIFYLNISSPSEKNQELYEAKISNAQTQTRKQVQSTLRDWLQNRLTFANKLRFKNESLGFGGSWSASYSGWDAISEQHIFSVEILTNAGKTLKRDVRIEDFQKDKIENETFALDWVRNGLQNWIETTGRFLLTVDFSTLQALPDGANWTAELQDAAYKMTTHIFMTDVAVREHLYFHFAVESGLPSENRVRDEVRFAAPYAHSELWARAADWAKEEIVKRVSLMRLWRAHLTYTKPENLSGLGTWTARPISRFEDELTTNLRYAIAFESKTGEKKQFEHVLTKPQTDRSGGYPWEQIRKASHTRLSKWLRKELQKLK